ncbi:MAG: D-alanyl-D-alanine carboxypeptidase family protein [Myxococcales bacterium]|nr:D-alanyl-D-alanine carboxypeptidase family protein [Myxococcales bacterium]
MRRLAPVVALALVACAPAYDDEHHHEEGALGVWRPGLTVGEAGGCSTAIVSGLSRQLIDEINCLRPNTLVDISDLNVQAGGGVWTFVQGAARGPLAAAIRERGRALSVNSALRTLPQQFLLYRWYRQGRCGISLAASPGRSRHESGLALDVNDNAGWRPALQNHGWRWLGASDPVHFDYVGGGAADLAGLSVLAFQRLWNRNHPGDRIDEDGLYGPQTEGRLLRAPTEGFARGACSAEPDPPPPPDPDPPPPPRDETLALGTRWLTLEGQTRDLVPEGSSAAIFDVLEGQAFDAVVEARPGADRAPAATRAGYAVAPALAVEAVTLEAEDGQGGWRVVAPLPAVPEAVVDLGEVGGGAARRVRLSLRAVDPGFGARLRGWLGAAYADAPADGRHESFADVFAIDGWTFDGARAEDTEGWTACGGAVRVDPGFGALVVDACAESPAWTRLDADGLRIEVRAAAPALTVGWPGGEQTVTLRGDGELEVVTLDLAGAPGWERPVTSLSLRAAAPFALDAVEAVDPIDDTPAPPPDRPPPPAGGTTPRRPRAPGRRRLGAAPAADGGAEPRAPPGRQPRGRGRRGAPRGAGRAHDGRHAGRRLPGRARGSCGRAAGPARAAARPAPPPPAEDRAVTPPGAIVSAVGNVGSGHGLTR